MFISLSYQSVEAADILTTMTVSLLLSPFVQNAQTRKPTMATMKIYN